MSGISSTAFFSISKLDGVSKKSNQVTITWEASTILPFGLPEMALPFISSEQRAWRTSTILLNRLLATSLSAFATSLISNRLGVLSEFQDINYLIVVTYTSNRSEGIALFNIIVFLIRSSRGSIVWYVSSAFKFCWAYASVFKQLTVRGEFFSCRIR
mgnify:CR=1 FL=1